MIKSKKEKKRNTLIKRIIINHQFSFIFANFNAAHFS